MLIGLWWLYKVFKRRRNEKQKKKYFVWNGGMKSMLGKSNCLHPKS
jgi:high-affinity Fe2+/Pb2+ permease